MSKKNFFTRLFSGNEPTADAEGNVSFSAEQFATLETKLESLGTEAKTATENAEKYAQLAASVEELSTKYAEMETTVKAHSDRLEKLKTVPAVKPVATATEPPIGAASDEADGVEKSAIAIALEEAQKAGETIRITA